MSERCEVIPSRTSVTFFAKSTHKSIFGKAEGLLGYVDAAWGDHGDLLMTPKPRMHVEFPVEYLKTGHPIEDKEMWKLIDSKRFPKIAADLTDIVPGQPHGSYAATGTITLAGLARHYDGMLTARRESDDIVIDGFLLVDVTNFGLKPATLFALRVEPIVKIHLHLTAALPLYARAIPPTGETVAAQGGR